MRVYLNYISVYGDAGDLGYYKIVADYLVSGFAEFIKKFKPHVSSTLGDPMFPSDFVPKEAKDAQEAPAAVPEKLTLNFFLPHETTLKDSKVLSVP